jgi:hypothetical protein
MPNIFAILESIREGDYSKDDILSLCFFFGTLIMVFWPWFFLVVTSGGLKMQGHLGRVAENSSQQVSFVVTFIAGVVNAAVVYLFSKAVASLAEQEITTSQDPQIPQIAFYVILKNRTFPTFLFQQRKPLLFWTVVLYLVGFAFVTPGITALLLPVRFTRSISLNGTELDFASLDTDCVNWFNNSKNPEFVPCNTFVSFRSNYTKHTQ